MSSLMTPVSVPSLSQKALTRADLVHTHTHTHHTHTHTHHTHTHTHHTHNIPGKRRGYVF